MSRFVECDDEPYANAWALWAQAQKNALQGRRGQAVLRELEAALLALPQPRLIEGALCSGGDVCALGALAQQRGVPREEMAKMDGEYSDEVGYWAHKRLGLTEALANAIQWENDEGSWESWIRETPEQRYERVLNWVRANLKAA